MEAREVKSQRPWEDYQHLSALFQFYLKLVLKGFSFCLGISGAVTAFVFQYYDTHDNEKLIRFGLVLPALLCIGMGCAFIQAVPSARELKVALCDLKSQLGLRLAPHGANLVAALWLFGILLLFVGLSLGVAVKITL